MLSVKKIDDINEAKVVKLYSSLLEGYLFNYDIAKDLFNPNMVNSEYDKVVLKKFHDDALEKANVLVLEDEVVGITYDNLDIIRNVLENKLVKKM